VATHKAIVKDGHLTLSEPTELPEGEVVELVQADPFSSLDFEAALDADERAKLQAAISDAWSAYRAGGRSFSLEEALAHLRSRG
jgi:hypothetical protein